MSEGMFTEEVIGSWVRDGAVSSSCSGEEVRARILRSLGNTVRFNGMCSIRWTVLAHSWLVGSVAEDFAHVACEPERTRLEARLCGMLHDIGETVTGDVIWPLKHGAFEEAYSGTYLPLELAFRSWAAERAFGVRGFDAMMDRAGSYVEHADRLCGELEMVCVSVSGDFGTGSLLGGPFADVAAMATGEAFARLADMTAERIRGLEEDESELGPKERPEGA